MRLNVFNPVDLCIAKILLRYKKLYDMLKIDSRHSVVLTAIKVYGQENNVKTWESLNKKLTLFTKEETG